MTTGTAHVRAREGMGEDNAPAWRLSAAWPIGLILAVLYGSLIPFEIDAAALGRVNVLGLFGIGPGSATREDVLTNILVYVPIGLSLMLAGRGRRSARLARVPLTVFVGAAVSITAEFLQTGIALRVASGLDVALNMLGTFGGALLALGPFDVATSIARQIRTRLSDRPFATVASLLTIGLLVYSLAPFDLVRSTNDLRASFQRADWSLARADLAGLSGPPLEALVNKLGGMAWFALLGYFGALAARESNRRAGIAFVSAAGRGIVLVILVELLQLLTRSHACESTVMVLGILAVLLGAWCAVFVVDVPSGSAWKQRLELAVPTALLASLGGLQVALLAAGCMDRHVGAGWSIDLSGVQWYPFEALWHRPIIRGAHETAATILTFAALATTLAIILRRARIANAWLITTAAVTLVAIAMEALQALTLTRTADLTGPTLALLAAVGVARTYPALRAAMAPLLPQPAAG